MGTDKILSPKFAEAAERKAGEPRVVVLFVIARSSASQQSDEAIQLDRHAGSAGQQNRTRDDMLGS